ncbi:hypothetical protein FBR02_03410 [Anaerolineae bacterium CFX9]|nr:hypothetical protein [Anaerolineae bacterium CFX9]
MPDYESVKVVLQRADSGLVLLIVCCAIVLSIGVYVAPRVKWFRRLAMASVVIVPDHTLKRLEDVRIMSPAMIIWTMLILGSQSFWYDEAFSLRMASLPAEMWPDAILNDVHPPVFYAIVAAVRSIFPEWITDARGLRAIPLAFGLIHIWLMRRLALRLYGFRAAEFATIFLGLMPAALYNVTELRSYTLLASLYTLGALSIAERRRTWLLIAVAIMPGVHNFGLLYGAALLALWAWRERERLWALLASVPMALWAAFPLLQSGIVADGYFPYLSLGVLARPLLETTIVVVRNEFILVTAIPILMITLYAVWDRRRDGLVMFLLFAVPVAVALISALWRPVYVPRTLYPAVMMLALVWAASAAQHAYLMRVTFLVLIIACSILIGYAGSNTRLDYAGMVREHCPNARALYATSIPAAFVLAANTDHELTVWDNAADDAGTFTPDDLPRYAFTTADSPDALPSPFCIMQIDQPLTAQSERDYIAALLSDREHRSTHVNISRWHELYFHEVYQS